MNTSVYTKESREGYISKWRSSGMSRNAFAREQGINYNNFKQWVLRASKKSGITTTPVVKPKKKPSIPFVSLQVHGMPQSRPTGMPLMELRLSNGRVLSFYQTVPIDYLQAVLNLHA